ncbi:MAG: hypothetical protein A3F83_06950 [Candidatus Glassbacteria bacterium RIFCSPLOWO2_12_FULL_58_11]|uniref:Dockerin domain-containing protein n=1 Tax=Candidatus Glassbacteria bacterium RIFCSPLOWO2_12_FULL_58_11 TaxID=1817867 RepID=A0A1F5YS63_9BACT|nr:MAG: hypothetical protein A3F83_06950 [Candidatus Glassbacteria bacterium RIFCSPLOWO2_12_FULL_58_11]
MIYLMVWRQKFESKLGAAVLPLILAAGCLLTGEPLLAASWSEDVNGDGRVTVTDVIALLLLGRADPQDRRADYDGDGTFGMNDAEALLANIGSGNLHAASVTADSWSVIGPGGGGGIFLPTISPFDSKIMLTHCDMTGAYISYDGGEKWRMFNLWNVPTDFEFDPVEANTIYASVKGSLYSEDRGSGLSLLYRSEDQGKRWRIIFPLVDNALPLDNLQSRDLLPSQVVPGTPDGSIDKVEVDPLDNRIIYLGLSPLVDYISDGSGGPSKSPQLVISTDRGASWKVIAQLSGSFVLGLYPGSLSNRPGEVLVFTDKACVRVDIASGQMTPVALPVSTVVETAGGKGIDGALLYILSNLSVNRSVVSGGVFRSSDWGASWTQVNNGLFTGVPSGKAPQIRALAVCEQHPEVLYIASSNPGYVSGSGGTAWRYGVFKSANSGIAWSGVWLANDLGYPTANYQGSWLDWSFDPGWGGKPIEMGVAPSDPNICFGGDNGRAYGTLDGGKTWNEVYSHNNPDNSVTSSGLDVTTCYGVHFDPFDREHIFISYTDIGLFHSYDGGKSWLHSISGVPSDWVNTCYQLEFDPAVKGRAWTAWSLAHDLPRDKMFSSDDLAWFAGGVAVTDDGGKTWRKSSNGLPANAAATDILVDPSSPAGKRTVYVAAFNVGVFKSTDDGASWKAINEGLGTNLYAWKIRRNPSGRLFLLLARGRRSSGTVPGALYTRNEASAQGNSQWEALPLPQGVDAPHDLEIDPVNPQIMYLCCWARQVAGQDVSGGVFRSDDGGQSWKQTFDERVRVNSAALDPRDPAVVFINTFQNSAWRSADRGEHWKRLEGYRFKWGQRAVPDLNNPGMLYLTTYGGSVYYGPDTGVPGAFEDIENMPANWW